MVAIVQLWLVLLMLTFCGWNVKIRSLLRQAIRHNKGCVSVT